MLHGLLGHLTCVSVRFLFECQIENQIGVWFCAAWVVGVFTCGSIFGYFPFVADVVAEVGFWLLENLSEIQNDWTF